MLFIENGAVILEGAIPQDRQASLKALIITPKSFDNDDIAVTPVERTTKSKSSTLRFTIANDSSIKS